MSRTPDPIPVGLSSAKRNLYIGGLSYSSTKESLTKYFETFGDLVDVHVPQDACKGRSKGFAFVKFVDPKAAEAVLLQNKGVHKIDGREVNVIASNRPENEPVTFFAHPLRSFTTNETFRCYFEGQQEKLGNITEAFILTETVNGTLRSRRCGYVTFENPDVEQIMRESKMVHQIDGEIVRLDHFEHKKDEERCRIRLEKKESKNRRRRVMVRRLHSKTNEITLHNYFESFGRIRDLILVRHKDTGYSKRFGFIEYDDAEDALKVLTYNNGIHIVDNVEIFTDLAEEKNLKRKAPSSNEESSGPSRSAKEGNDDVEEVDCIKLLDSVNIAITEESWCFVEVL